MRKLEWDILDYLNSPEFTYDTTRSYYGEKWLSMMQDVIEHFNIPITLDEIDMWDYYIQACIYVHTKNKNKTWYNIIFDIDAQFNGSTKEELAEHMMWLIEWMNECYNNIQLGII
jgi:hypothetical protein